MAHEKVTDPWVATKCILVGTAANTAVKALLAIFLGGWSFGWRVSVAFALTLVAAGATAAAFRFLI